MMAFTFLVAGAFFGFGFVVGGYFAIWLWSRALVKEIDIFYRPGGGPPKPRPTPVSRHGRGRPGSMRAGAMKPVSAWPREESQSARPEKPSAQPNVPSPGALAKAVDGGLGRRLRSGEKWQRGRP